MKKTVEDKFDFKPLGKAIKNSRIGREMTQEKVAELLGVELPYYSRIENNGQHPSLQVFVELIQLLNVSVDEMLLPETDLKTTKRRLVDDLLKELTENELEVIIGTVKGIVRSREK